jgi:tetratricopeptide (TPR) repeat protein
MIGRLRPRNEAKVKTAWLVTLVAVASAAASVAWADTAELESAQNLLTAHRYDDAMSAVDSYLKQYPKDPTATIVKSDIYAAWGDWDLSVDVLEDALTQHENNVDLWLALALTYREKLMRSGMLGKMSNGKKSRKAIEKAFEIDPTHMKTRRQMVRYLVHAPGFAGGDKERAEAIALETLDMDETEGRFQLAAVYWKQDKPDAAKEQFRRALELAPGDVDVLLVFGEALIDMEDYAGCEKLYLDFITQWPDRPQPYGGLGDCYKEQKRADEAIAQYLIALEKDEWFGYARYNAARLYEKEKDKEQAAYHYRILLERNPGYVDAGTAKKQLRKIEKGR